jgi:multidrug efflux pump subunit AcrA (membrane-fusion protein)
MTLSCQKHLLLLMSITLATWGHSLAAQESEMQKYISGSSARLGIDDDYWILQLINDVEVPAKQAGQIDIVLVKEGQSVRADEIIAKLDDRLAKWALEESTARVNLAQLKSEDTTGIEDAKAKVDLYENKFLPIKNLYEKGSASGFDYREALAGYRVSQIGYDRATVERRYSGLELAVEQANLGKTQEALEQFHIRAPFDGLVMAVDREAKEWVNAGDKVVRVVRMDRLRVKGALGIEQHTPSSVSGRSVNVTVKIPGLNAEQTFNGTIVFAKPDLTLQKDKFEVWAEIENRMDENGNWLLYPGLRCDMKILPR